MNVDLEIGFVNYIFVSFSREKGAGILNITCEPVWLWISSKRLFGFSGTDHENWNKMVKINNLVELFIMADSSRLKNAERSGEILKNYWETGAKRPYIWEV